MNKDKYTYEVTDNKTKEVIDSGSFELYSADPFKIPSDIKPLYKSYTTLTYYETNTGAIVKQEERKVVVKDLPSYTLPQGNYMVHREWGRMNPWILDHAEYSGQTYEDIVKPYFQRERVWTEAEQISYIEHVIKGGKNGKDIYFNCPSWQTTHEDKNLYCVDGLQRITAVEAFHNNKFPIFRHVYFKDIDRLPNLICAFNVHILDFQTQEEVLSFYIQLNSTGVAHTKEELDRVRDLKEKL